MRHSSAYGHALQAVRSHRLYNELRHLAPQPVVDGIFLARRDRHVDEVIQAEGKTTVGTSPDVHQRPKGWQAMRKSQDLVEYARRLQAKNSAGDSGEVVEVVQAAAHINP